MIKDQWDKKIMWAWALAIAVYLPSAYFAIPSLFLPDFFDAKRHLVVDSATGDLVDIDEATMDGEGEVSINRWCDPKNKECFSWADKRIKKQMLESRFASSALTFTVGLLLVFVYRARDKAVVQAANKDDHVFRQIEYRAYHWWLLGAAALSFLGPLPSIIGKLLGWSS